MALTKLASFAMWLTITAGAGQACDRSVEFVKLPAQWPSGVSSVGCLSTTHAIFFEVGWNRDPPGLLMERFSDDSRVHLFSETDEVWPNWTDRWWRERNKENAEHAAILRIRPLWRFSDTAFVVRYESYVGPLDDGRWTVTDSSMRWIS